MSFRAQQSIWEASRGVNNGVTAPEYWGYWAMTPEWTLGGGYTGSLSNVPYGYDANCICYVVDNSQAFFMNPGDTKQMRLSYASGPLSFGLALEDGSDNSTTLDDSMGVAARLKYDGDAFSAGLTGGYWSDDDDPAANGNVEWQIGGGASFSLSDMFNLSLGAAYGEFHTNNNYFTVSVLAAAELSDTIHAEIGAGYSDRENASNHTSVSGGVYWTPVDQLRIGAESEWYKTGGMNSFTAALVTVYSF